MSGGFFRGTSADQDTRFSNKQAKLLKSQKFAPELEHLVDMTKVKIDTVKPWIAKRVTELLGFEDEVLINFIYGLLDRKEVNGKEVQIQLTGFMEKNSGKFMKELWTLLLSAQKNASGIPQQILDATDEELRKKKAEADRITHEIQKRKEKEVREFELENLKKMDGGNDDSRTNNAASDPTLRRLQAKGSSEEKEADERNGSRKMNRASKSPNSVDRSLSNRSPSRSVSKSFSNSRSYSAERYRSRSLSDSPQPRGRFISPERQYRSPRRRSVSPRQWPSPRKPRSPLRRRLHHSRQRSPSYSQRRSLSPVRRRLPSPSRRRSPSPVRRRSPSPVRRRSPSPVRRRSPSPVRRRSRRSPSPARRRSPSPVHRRSPLGVRRRSPTTSRRRSPPRWNSPSPVRRRSPSPLRRRSPPPRSPRHRRRSPLRSPRLRYSSSESPLRQGKERVSRHGSASPVRRPRKQTVHRDSSETSSVEEISQAREDKNYRNNSLDRHLPTSGNRKSSSVKDFRHEEYSPERVDGNRSAEARGRPDNTELRKKYQDKRSSKASMGTGHSESPIPKESPMLVGIEYGPGRPDGGSDVLDGRRPVNKHGRDSPSLSERVQKSSSREGNKADEGKHSYSSKAEDRNRHDKTEVVQKSLKKVDRKNRPGDSDSDSDKKEKFRSDYVEKRKRKRSSRHETASDDNASDDSEIDERKEAKRRRKEEKRLRKEEKRRRREERHRRREERRASKLKAKSVDTVTPPSDFEKLRNDADDSEREVDARKESNPSDTEETLSEQKRLEIELRKKALESLRAKKGISH
ncbi:serine/arginine repetitive matrix protein 1-like isoform X4 [Macadamia integrifolia]|uniref:serine/arginine repetitive matrix protein 1-like isoform X4 n=1 Tax=Macadamia integrifolia TaxID=60698 RepID=UPI001C52F35C|nr:serine/arginine repetitive matrix protein 1-like isoform X4 [Macadamia integrifolia]